MYNNIAGWKESLSREEVFTWQGSRSCSVKTKYSNCLPRNLRWTPVFLQVLACLQILARGNCFADIYHMSFISMQTAAATFHRFTRYFAREMYAEHIFLPTGDYQKKVMTQYDRLGFSGATGSTDVTHIPWGMCPYNQARSYKGKGTRLSPIKLP